MKNDAGKYDSYSDGGLPNGPYQEPVNGASAGNALSDFLDELTLNSTEKARVFQLAALASQSTPVAQEPMHASVIKRIWKECRDKDMDYVYFAWKIEERVRASIAAPTAAQGLSDAESMEIRDTLEAAKVGIDWYRDACPELDSGTDDEMFERIDAAVAILSAAQEKKP